MYHSIYFGDVNTWDDWHIVPSSRPVIKPPTRKTKYLDISGMNGVLDLSESLTGYPVFNDREGSLEFLVMNDYQPWEELYSKILAHLHGRKMRMILEDDLKYFYYGSFEVEEWQSTTPRSTVTIKYKVGAYKWNIGDDWLWDPFNFETGVIQSTSVKNILISNKNISSENNVLYWTEYDFSKELLDSYAPISPVFVTDPNSDITVKYTSWYSSEKKTQVLLSDNTDAKEQKETTIPDLIFYGQDLYRLYFHGSGTVSVYFRGGRL